MPKKLTQEQWKIIKELAGTVFDSDIAKQVKCSTSIIREYRKKFNIPTYKTNEISKLCGIAGSAKDTDILKIVDVSAFTIHRYKKANNICKKDTKASDGAKYNYCSLADLQAKLKQYAGTATDAEVAQLCGCDTLTVYQYRKQHNISPVKNGKCRRLTEEQKLKIEELLEDSSYSNMHIAGIIGCGSKNIAQYRKKLGYPKYVNTKSPIDHEKMKELAGTIPDPQVAKQCNCSRVLVVNYRKCNNIPAFK